MFSGVMQTIRVETKLPTLRDVHGIFPIVHEDFGKILHFIYYNKPLKRSGCRIVIEALREKPITWRGSPSNIRYAMDFSTTALSDVWVDHFCKLFSKSDYSFVCRLSRLVWIDMEI